MVHIPYEEIPKDFVEFNKVIGLPKHPKTGEPTTLYDYQIQLLEDWNKHSWVLVNKSRKIGVSEIVLRIIAFKCFNAYAGHQVLLVAGNRIQHARRLMRRFQKLFDNNIIGGFIEEKNADRILLANNTEILAMPSNDTALRGVESVKCIYLDEAAHFNVIDDSQVYDALAPNLDNTNGDFIIVSTPNGKRGIFYDLWIDEDNKFYKLPLPYTVSLGKLLDESSMERKRKDRTIDFAQEYECAFTSPKGSFITSDLIQSIEDDYVLEAI